LQFSQFVIKMKAAYFAIFLALICTNYSSEAPAKDAQETRDQHDDTTTCNDDTHNTRVAAGAEYTSGNFWYACVDHSGHAETEPRGCLDTAGKRINIGESWYESAAGSHRFKKTCTLDKASNHLSIVGTPEQVSAVSDKRAPPPDDNHCVDANGQVHAVGEQYTIGDYWQKCITEKNGAVEHTGGCVDPKTGRQLGNGESFVRGNFAVTCRVDAEHGSATTEITGCVNEDGQNVAVGSTWRHPKNGVRQFEKTCVKKSDGSVSITATVVQNAQG